ncbi:hypothetical protein KSC_052980 [Ktedonobacter sp. SOSP1-52]|uniref:hypothetical protein n=1 Tax=Ktedonobacter sp. SOSP1-52 TaxID=2778366 RepID=UPI001916446A|nr:hypothetical protein [Ktedonobacter sp. SOSP1-52]GHO66406.1 hypothetical protein KSC_052980 [Ktedonobacter sp. SOSP1-52]
MAGKYHDLYDTWIYQEIKAQVHADLQAQQCQDLHHILLKIIEARFPRLIIQAHTLGQLQPERLQQLIAHIGSAQREREAKTILDEVEQHKISDDYTK